MHFLLFFSRILLMDIIPRRVNELDEDSGRIFFFLVHVTYLHATPPGRAFGLALVETADEKRYRIAFYIILRLPFCRQ